jgi:hypothetical protein
MTEQQLNTLREQDKNLRDAIQQDAMEQPQMPADLNVRLMQRVAAEKKQPRRIIWPWVAAACVAGMLMIWLTPPKDEAPEVAQTPATEVQQEAPLIAQQAPKEAPEVAQTPTPATEVQQPAPVAKKAPAKTKAQTAEPIATESMLPTQDQLALVHEPEKHASEAPAKTLTERDLPITRPENLKYTPEELALMKQQAHEAYLKWVELELEISKHYIEQTAQNE